jgi:hypothetical protein
MNPESARLLTLAGEYRTQSRIAKGKASLRRIGASRSIPYSPEPARTGHRFGLQATPHVNICWRENEPTNQAQVSHISTWKEIGGWPIQARFWLEWGLENIAAMERQSC